MGFSGTGVGIAEIGICRITEIGICILYDTDYSRVNVEESNLVGYGFCGIRSCTIT